ncbi:MAG: phosphate acyltransferase PlsX [Bacteroidales bacterium]|nr:phosphate acyltransferase PlsX [Bacteroidales bacterium]
MKIGLDVMGGDYAPDSILKGAILAQKVLPEADRIVLIGQENIILDKLREYNSDASLFDIVNASEVISMGEQPTRAFSQKPDSSITKGFHLLKTGHIDAFASAGNTGAMLVGSVYSVNVVQGIIRPATTSVLPKENGGVGVLIDVGTNPDSKPDVLYQFGLLGSIFAQFVYGIENPKVGLLNIGEEEEKGNLLCQSAFRLMKDTQDYNFIGNIESRDLFNDKADVIVCDGFTGNIVLKQAESMYRLIKKRGIEDEFINRMNYENYGGTPILGVNGTVIIGHGISNDIAIKNMVILAREVHEAKVSEKISDALSQYTQSRNFNGKS